MSFVINAFNILDILALIVFSFCVFRGIRKGLFRMAFSLLSIMIALYIARILYPHVGSLLREHTGIYEAARAHIISTLRLRDIIERYIQQGETVVLSHLPLPGIILDMLIENNTLSIRQSLGVTTLEGFIGSFLANIFMNILSAIIVFILVLVIMRFIGSTLDIIARLPFIKSFNKLGGAVTGAFVGFVAIWILVTLYLFFFVGISPLNEEIFNNSFVGQFLYDSGLLLRGLTDIP